MRNIGLPLTVICLASSIVIALAEESSRKQSKLAATVEQKALVEESMSNDSHVLVGIAEYYLALSQLQILNLENLDLSKPKSIRTLELKKIASARRHFGKSRGHLVVAIKSSQELLRKISAARSAPLGVGLKRITLFDDALAKIISALDSHYLPKTSLLHEASFRIQDYVLYGKKRSRQSMAEDGPKIRF